MKKGEKKTVIRPWRLSYYDDLLLRWAAAKRGISISTYIGMKLGIVDHISLENLGTYVSVQNSDPRGEWLKYKAARAARITTSRLTLAELAMQYPGNYKPGGGKCRTASNSIESILSQKPGN